MSAHVSRPSARRNPQWSARSKFRSLQLTLLTTGLLLALHAHAQTNATGRWTPIGNSWHHMQVHMALLRGDANYHSKLISWWYAGDWWTGDPSNPPYVQRGSFWGWNPSTNLSNNDCSIYPQSQFTPLYLDSPGFNLFCGGHSTLTSGDLLVTGGHDNANDVGLRTSFIFRRNAPGGQQWSQQGTLAAGRWYPTNTTLADGKVLTFSGTRFEQHMVVFGGTAAPQDPISPATEDINRLGLNIAGQWDPAVTRPAGETNWPEQREGHTAVLYTPTNQMIVFGGRQGGTSNPVQPDVWLLTITAYEDGYAYTWFRPTIAGPPPRRTRHTAITRRLSGTDVRMIVYGGLDINSQPLSDTWELSRDAQGFWHWTQLITAGTSPNVRYGHAAIYDALNDRMLVFGGRTTGGVLADNDIYALSLATNTWSRVSLATKPDAREGHSWFIDPYLRAGSPFPDTVAQDQRVVLFGGQAATTLKRDLWVLWINKSNDATNGAVQWQSMGEPPGPTARARHTPLWDLTASTPGYTDYDRMIVFGGNTGGATASTEAWKLDGTLSTWTQLPQSSAALSGETAVCRPGDVWALDPELYDPATGLWTDLNTPKLQPYYPFTFQLLSGNLLFAGPPNNAFSEASYPTYLFRRSPPAWQQLPIASSGFGGGSAVMFRPGEIMKCGTKEDAPSGTPTVGTTKKIKIDANDNVVGSGWVTSANAMLPRIFHNLTILPTGQVLVTGGLGGSNAGQDSCSNPGQRQAQIWSPDGGGGIGQWASLLAADPVRRGYHSTAILLPDGRVLSGGGETWDPTDQDCRLNPNAIRPTIFCPPYLFDAQGNLATRPQIVGAHDVIGYGNTFQVIRANGDTVSSVCLIRPGAVTHAYNQDQWFVPLSFVNDPAPCRLSVTAPPNANWAPPGDYLLFIVNNHSVPSVGKWVTLQSGPNGPPPACPCCGGCPFADTRTAAGWQVENSILGRSPSAEVMADLYCLKSTPAEVGGRYQIRLRENEQEFTTLDQARLLIVDHLPATRVYSVGEQMVLGAPQPLYRATTRSGQDVTGLLNGSDVSYFVGEPGETLLVELVPPFPATAPDSIANGLGIDPIVIDPGGKGGGGGGMVAGGAQALQSRAVDAAILDATGILLQGRDASAEWRTVRKVYPRELFDECTIDTLDRGPVRLVFVGRHSLRFVGRMDPLAAVTPQPLELLAARHTRLGDVLGAVAAADGATTALTPGDTLTMDFAATPVPPTLVRDFFLLSRGVYSSVQPALKQKAQSSSLPARFALFQNQPNPFTLTTTIKFDLAQPVRIRLDVFDLQGRRIRRLADDPFLAGRWSLEWDRRDQGGNLVRSGVYLYTLSAGSFSAKKKMVLLP